MPCLVPSHRRILNFDPQSHCVKGSCTAVGRKPMHCFGSSDHGFEAKFAVAASFGKFDGNFCPEGTPAVYHELLGQAAGRGG